MSRDLFMEEAWAGGVGDAYTAVTLGTEHRRPFWEKLIAEHEIASALEVGCSYGANLIQLSEWIDVAGIDINKKAIEGVPKEIPTYCCSASALPYPDKSFDLTFTAGVLLHVPPTELPRVMAEIVRTSKRYVFALEYFGEEERSVRWRYLLEGIWYRDYGRIYERDFNLSPVDTGNIDEGTWMGVTWWLFEKP